MSYRFLLFIPLFICCSPRGQPGDVRGEAAGVLGLATVEERALSMSEVVEEGYVSSAALSADLPKTIRVWRRSAQSGSSCEGEVTQIKLDDYVAGVLPHEWIASWNEQSLMAGAIVIRTYASFWVKVGGKYQCADVDDTTWTQVYNDARDKRADAAVAATKGMVVTQNSALIYAEYSAENTGTTVHGVEDEVCRGRTLNGHGRGLCQWGSQRWAEKGKNATWIVEHYFPGSEVRTEKKDWGLDDVLIATLQQRKTPIHTYGVAKRVWLSAVNTSSHPWMVGSVYVATKSGRPSILADTSWSEPSKASTLSHTISPGQTARFEFFVSGQTAGVQSDRLVLVHRDGRRSQQSWLLTTRAHGASNRLGRMAGFVGVLVGFFGLCVVVFRWFFR